MEHVLNLSYGKDSLACLHAIEKLGLPLDRIVTAEMWATKTIPADLPEMVAFKEKADQIIKDRYGLIVEHISATPYEDWFYKVARRGKNAGSIYGFPCVKGAWCVTIKSNALKLLSNVGDIKYLGIAADEPERVERWTRDGYMLPLVMAHMSEADCYKWCEENDLLSPIYKNAARGGCWFCHNQSIDQLRKLRRSHPELWEMLLKWDKDSPITFHPDGHSVHDFERRFFMEDVGAIDKTKAFRWKDIL